MRHTMQANVRHSAHAGRVHWAAGAALLLLVTLVLSALPAAPAGAQGGTYQPETLYPAGITGSRANLEWRNSFYGDLLKRRTLLKVYAVANEYILVGSSAVAATPVAGLQTNGDVRIYNPDQVQGAIGSESIPNLAGPIAGQPGAFANGFSCVAQRAGLNILGQGRIASRNQEVAGPDTFNPTTLQRSNIANSFFPCFYRAPTTGIYSVAFWGPVGDNSDQEIAPTGSIADTSNGNNFNARQGTSVAAWNVTVRPDPASPANITGRLFARYLTLFTGGNNRPLFSRLYTASSDGYRYQVDLNGMDPNGFLMFGNSIGFYDSDGKTPLYRDILAQTGPGVSVQDANQLRKIQGGVSLAPPSYPFFFNPPDEAVLDALGVPRAPIIPIIRTINYAGSLGGNVSRFGTGGTFTIRSSATGPFELVISRDGIDYSSTKLENRVLRGVQAQIDTAVTLAWDGRDNAGNFFPVGGPYLVRTTSRGGEFHFPMLDVENNLRGGPTVRLLNRPLEVEELKFGPTTAFYDDRGYRTIGGTVVGTAVNGQLCNAPNSRPPSILASGSDGFDSSGAQNGGVSQRAFGSLSQPNLGNAGASCSPNGSFGDTKGLDLWTYVPGSVATAALVIVDPNAPPPPPPDTDVGVTKQANPPTVPVGQQTTFTITASNTSNVAAPNVVVTEYLPAGLRFVSATPPPGTTFDPATLLWTIGTLNPGQQVVLTMVVTVTAPGPHTNYVDITTSGNDTNPNNNRSSSTVTGLLVDLSVLKRPDKTVYGANDIINYTIAYSNTGQVDTTGTTLTETVPANTQFNPADSDPRWTCPSPAAGTTCTLSLGTLAVGARGSLIFSIRVLAPLPPNPAPIVNTVTIGDDGKNGPDINPRDNTSQAQVPPGTTAINLVSFTATAIDGGVAVRWVTAAEINTWGFHILRSADGGRAGAVRVTTDLVPGQGRSGGNYSVVDRTADPGVSYSYWLQEIEVGGATNEYGPARVTAQHGSMLRVYLPVAAR